jgi:hypothetical protein
MASNLFTCSFFTFLICAWIIYSVDGLSLEDRLQQLTDNYVTNYTFFLSLVTTSLKLISLLKKKVEIKSILQDKIVQLEMKDARLEALELKMQQQVNLNFIT